MKYTIFLSLSIILSAPAFGKCLVRDSDPKLNLENIERPRENRILIMSSKQNSCTVPQCKILVGDLLIFDKNSLNAEWRRRDGKKYVLKFMEITPPGGGNKIWKSEEYEKFVFYLLQHNAWRSCRENGFTDQDRELDNERCRTYEFESFYASDALNQPYVKPDSVNATWDEICTEEGEPGSGGGSEPPPPPPPPN